MPTEELFGAYHFLLESPGIRSRFAARLKQAGIRLSDAGLEQALKGEVVSSSADRTALGKLLAAMAQDESIELAKGKRSA